MSVPPTLLCTATFPANTGFAWDFIERLYARMADELVTDGVRTMVAYPAIGETPLTLAGSAAVPVILDTRLATRRARKQMMNFIRRENVQVVYFTDRPTWSVWYRSLRAAGVRRIIVHDHTSGERTAPTGIRRLVKSAIVNTPGVASDMVVGVSDFVAHRARTASLIPSRKIVRVWNGLEPVQPESENGHPSIHSLLGLSGETAVIGCACRATPEKGVHVLFRAFDRICRERDKRCVLAYIGTGPQFAELQALRAGLKCRERIYMLGYLPQAATLLRTATVCAVPSVWQEAFALSVLEMMARSRAVVATRVGGVPEVIQDGVSGLLVPPDDVDALADAITKILDSTLLRDALGRAARERSSRLFTADQQISAMLCTFRDAFVN